MNKLKRIALLLIIACCGLSLTACSNHSHRQSAQEKENSSLKAENSSLKAKKQAQSKSSSAAKAANNQQQGQTANSSSTSNAVIKTPEDAAALVTHAMSVSPDIYHAKPTTGGFLVNRDDMPDQSAVVHYDGSITWSNGDTQSYDSAAATTYNGTPSTFHPSH